jgi:hypothetical protein
MARALTLREVEDRLRAMLVYSTEGIEGSVHEEADDLLLDAMELSNMDHIVNLYIAVRSTAPFHYSRPEHLTGHVE